MEGFLPRVIKEAFVSLGVGNLAHIFLYSCVLYMFLLIKKRKDVPERTSM
jgi:hypothetical protein